MALGGWEAIPYVQASDDCWEVIQNYYSFRLAIIAKICIIMLSMYSEQPTINVLDPIRRSPRPRR
jgi:hypothetical protein